MRSERLAMVETGLRDYPPASAFHPDEPYAEYPFEGGTGPRNPIYAGVRSLLRQLGLDEARFGTKAWNPLGELIKPGMRVLLKPNWVRHYHGTGGDVRSLVTHSAVIRAMLDYAVIALQGHGEIIVGDAPVQAADFDAVRALSAFDPVAAFYAAHCSIPVSVVDFRKVRSRKNQRGYIVAREESDGDPRGYRVVRFGSTSHHDLERRRLGRLRVTNYDPAEMHQHHAAGQHEYLISATVLSSDVILNLPKLKTHKKAGLSVAMKNFFGIVGHKEWLPHHTVGTPLDGGDQYLHPSLRKRWMAQLEERIDERPSGRRRLVWWLLGRALSASKRVKSFSDNYSQGSWYGNDTVWRTTLDLDQIAIYADADGVLQPLPQRRVFHVVDGIVAGQGDGPLEPEPNECGLLLAGHDMVLLDHLCAALMGLRADRIPTLVNALAPAVGQRLTGFRLDQAVVVHGDGRTEALSDMFRQRHLAFHPPRGWLGQLESHALEEAG